MYLITDGTKLVHRGDNSNKKTLIYTPVFRVINN